MKDETNYRDISLKHNNAGCREVCPCCGHTFRAEVGIVPFLDGTNRPACQQCAERYAPAEAKASAEWLRRDSGQADEPGAWSLGYYIIERGDEDKLAWVDWRQQSYGYSGPCAVEGDTLVLLDMDTQGKAELEEPFDVYIDSLPAWDKTTHYYEQHLTPTRKPVPNDDALPF